MRIADIDKRLDMQCDIAVAMNSVWLERVGSTPYYITARLRNRDGLSLELYFQKNRLPKNAVSFILSNKNASEKESYYYVREKLDRDPDLLTAMELMQQPYVISTGTYLSGSDLRFRFRFHKSSLPAINEYLSRISIRKGNGRITYLGPSSGIVAIINEINENAPLSVVRFVISLSTPVRSREEVQAAGIETIGEMDIRNHLTGPRKIILYSTGRLDWAEPLSEAANLYGFHTIEPFSDALITGADSARIPIMAYFGNVMGDKIEMTVFLPTSEANEYLNEFLSLAKNSPDANSRLILCSPLSPALWEWL